MIKIWSARMPVMKILSITNGNKEDEDKVENSNDNIETIDVEMKAIEGPSSETTENKRFFAFCNSL